MNSLGPGSLKRPQWQKLYEEVVLELDQNVLPSRVQAARTAIHTRIVELRTAQPTEEDSRLEGALRILNALKKMYD